jgi:GT2 family glycosyltransferase
MTPAVSVVIPTYRRPALLAGCLEALMHQQGIAHSYEILVCDDGPDEATQGVATAYAARAAARGVRLTYIAVVGTQGPAAARNRGWRAARAPVIAFTDDDTVPSRGWLAAGLAALARWDAWAIAGRIEVPVPPEATDYERNTAELERTEFATANCFVRRSALERIGGFDERFTAAWREDSDLQFSLLRAGGKVMRTDSARVVHPVRPAPWGVSISQVRKSHFDALLYKKHADYYRTRIAATPWNYYLIVAALAAAVLAALVGRPGIGAAAGTLWLILTLAFAAKRLRATSLKPAHVAEMLWTSIVIPPLAVAWRLYGACKFRVAFF